jgi:hypothetical protein
MISLEKYEGMIKSLAWNCYCKLPQGYLSFEDLLQEGRSVYAKMIRRRFRMDGARFGTVLHAALVNHFRKVLRTAYTKKRAHLRLICDVDPDELIHRVPDQLELLQFKQFLDYLKEYDAELADYFICGPSDDLIQYVHELRGNKVKSVRVTRRCVEKYFGCKLKELFESWSIGRIKIKP